MIITYNLNKDLIFRMFFEVDSKLNFQDKNLIYEIEKENLFLNERISDLFKERRAADKKQTIINKEIEKRKIDDDQRIKNSNLKLTLIKKKISEKEFEIERIKKSIEKIVTIKEMNFKKNVFVTNPTKSNLETYLELLYTKEIIFKLRKNIEIDKIVNEKLKIDLKDLKKAFEEFKKLNGIFSESISEKENYNLESVNPLIDETYINTELIDIGRYNTLIKEKEFLNDEETEEIFFPDRVFMMKINDHNLVKKLNLNFTQNKNKNSNYTKIIQNKYNIPKHETKYKEKVKITSDVNLNNKSEEELNMKINENEKRILNADDKILELSQKINKYVNSNKDLRSKINKLNENIKFADFKINMLKSYISELEGEDITFEEKNAFDDEDFLNSGSFYYFEDS